LKIAVVKITSVGGIQSSVTAICQFHSLAKRILGYSVLVSQQILQSDINISDSSVAFLRGKGNIGLDEYQLATLCRGPNTNTGYTLEFNRMETAARVLV